MPSDGPSKEELEYYYKNSRKYFDELAKYYQTADPEYYEKNIAPFYSVFGSVSSPSAPGSSRALVAVIAAGVIALGIAGAALFLVQSTQDTDDEHKTENIEKNSTKETNPAGIPADTTSAVQKSDYRKALEYYDKKDYGNAERYFKKVAKSDKNYEDAQKKIEEIEDLRKSEQKNEDNSSRDRYSRPKPVERIR